MRSVVFLVAVATLMLWSPDLLACANSMEGEVLLSTKIQQLARPIFTASVGVGVVLVGALMFVRLRRQKDD